MSSTLDKLYGILEKNGLNGSSTQRSSNGHKVSGVDLASLRRKEGLKIKSRARVVREGSVT
ncbi:hypothetical protein HanIR_Chr11g0541161 [Helianthus annuus]|nr:hypothetical protein HanIR_Chr11g0541161 [Helianthus annuus]